MFRIQIQYVLNALDKNYFYKEILIRAELFNAYSISARFLYPISTKRGGGRYDVPQGYIFVENS